MQFFSELDTILTNTAISDKIILMGDFNAMVGRDCGLWGNTIVKHGVWYNGILLLSICAEHKLVITNTIFKIEQMST